MESILELEHQGGQDLPRRLRARASTCRTSAARRSTSRRAAPLAARSPSCAAPTPGRARSSPAARPAARPRWSCSTSTTPTSWTSSGARRARRRRRPRCATPASTCRSTVTASPRSSTRTPTTRSASRDEFMEPRETGEEWQTTRAQRAASRSDTHDARDVLGQIADAAWRCADPGMQYDTTINDWHTCPNSGRINASNPCSEYMHVDDSACNLASINLMKFRRADGTFDTDDVRARRRRRCSSPRRSSSRRRATRPRRSATTPATSASSASATPTWARC